MADKPIWTGSPQPIKGLTPFGYFDNDLKFQADGPKLAKQIAHKLGYPVTEVELTDEIIYASFEEAIYTYSSEVNRFNITENLINLEGTPSTDLELTHKQISPNLGNIIQISKQYGSESGVGGNVDYKKGNIDIITNQQNYDLDFLWANTQENGKEIEIKTIYHTEKPIASTNFYGGQNTSLDYTFNSFGWNNNVSNSKYLLFPIYDDLLKMQNIEFNNEIRRSAFSFKLINNKLTIFPIPVYNYTLYFDYILVEDRNNPFNTGNNPNQDVISDFSNTPYGFMEYTKINTPGLQWIFDYTYALCKIILGEIRSKYASIPIPDGDVALDGDTLRSEGIQERENLLENLRTTLENASRKNRMEAKKDELENMDYILSRVATKIYIG